MVLMLQSLLNTFCNCGSFNNIKMSDIFEYINKLCTDTGFMVDNVLFILFIIMFIVFIMTSLYMTYSEGNNCVRALKDSMVISSDMIFDLYKKVREMIFYRVQNEQLIFAINAQKLVKVYESYVHIKNNNKTNRQNAKNFGLNQEDEFPVEHIAELALIKGDNGSDSSDEDDDFKNSLQNCEILENEATPVATDCSEIFEKVVNDEYRRAFEDQRVINSPGKMLKSFQLNNNVYSKTKIPNILQSIGGQRQDYCFIDNNENSGLMQLSTDKDYLNDMYKCNKALQHSINISNHVNLDNVHSEGSHIPIRTECYTLERRDTYNEPIRIRDATKRKLSSKDRNTSIIKNKTQSTTQLSPLKTNGNKMCARICNSTTQLAKNSAGDNNGIDQNKRIFSNRDVKKIEVVQQRKSYPNASIKSVKKKPNEHKAEPPVKAGIFYKRKMALEKKRLPSETPKNRI